MDCNAAISTCHWRCVLVLLWVMCEEAVASDRSLRSRLRVPRVWDGAGYPRSTVRPFAPSTPLKGTSKEPLKLFLY